MQANIAWWFRIAVHKQHSPHMCRHGNQIAPHSISMTTSGGCLPLIYLANRVGCHGHPDPNHEQMGHKGPMGYKYNPPRLPFCPSPSPSNLLGEIGFHGRAALVSFPAHQLIPSQMLPTGLQLGASVARFRTELRSEDHWLPISKWG